MDENNSTYFTFLIVGTTLHRMNNATGETWYVWNAQWVKIAEIPVKETA